MISGSTIQWGDLGMADTGDNINYLLDSACDEILLLHKGKEI